MSCIFKSCHGKILVFIPWELIVQCQQNVLGLKDNKIGLLQVSKNGFRWEPNHATHFFIVAIFTANVFMIGIPQPTVISKFIKPIVSFKTDYST